MPAPRIRKIALGILVASLGFRLAFLGQGLESLVTRGPLYDDSFYCFAIARNIAAGLGSTFDGLHLTNGYQPLYVALLVPLYWLGGSHATFPIYAALFLSAVFNVATGWVLFRILAGFVRPLAALFGLLLWGFGPAVVRQSINGLETSLAMFLLAVSLEVYVRVYRPQRVPTARSGALLGLLLGLAVLARVDAVLFVLALMVDAARRGLRRQARAAIPVVAVMGALLVPWAVANEGLFGSVLPESGKATRLLSEAYAPHDVPAVADLSFDSGPPVRLLLANVERSFLLLGTSPPVHVFTRGMERVLTGLHRDRGEALVAIGSFLALVLLALVVISSRGLGGHAPFPSGLRFLYVHALLLVAAYSFVVFGQIFYSRYYYPIFFFSILLGAFAFDVLWNVMPRRAQPVVAAALFALYATLLPLMSWHRIQNGDYRFLEVVDWIEAHTTPRDRIGVFNSGAIGYFSDRRVLNLDGKVNPEALRALEADAVVDYVATERLDYVIDHEWILERFLGRHASAPGLHFEQVADAAELGVPGWRAYRVVYDAPLGASSALALPAP